ncbi:MAG: CRISPR-associated endonuclease Cas1 [Candidatus Tumulicola sp.]
MLSGYGVKIAVDRRHLAVSDGIGRQRREGRFAKATSRIKRLVVIAQTGFISLEALRWLHDAKASFVQLDYDATILTASVNALDDARLRRAQALIPNTEYRLSISRELLEAKLKAQLAVLDSFGLTGTEGVRDALSLLDRADRLGVALVAEARGAEAYWGAWSQVPIQFARRDRVPDHWRTFGSRRSPFTAGPRYAANPLNAMLNYLYALLESETRIALAARGLDCGLALFHADEPGRQSLAADVMEPVRPHADAFVLNLARTRTFSAKDFAETREGWCRLSSGLAQELARTMAQWAKLVAPYAEGVARHVARLAKSGLGMSTPIGPMPSRERARVKVRHRPIAAPATPQALRSVPISAASNACRACGAKLRIRRRVYCDQCFPEQVAAKRHASTPAFRAAGQAKVKAMRAAGHDPATTPEAQRRRAGTASKQRKAGLAWRDDGSLDGVDFRRDILPKLQSLPVRVIAEAMDSTISHGSKVRLGKLVPHRRHWKALMQTQ